MANTSTDRESRDPYPRWLRFHSFFGPPLQPSAKDIAWCSEIANGWIRDRGTPRVLVLGVTPQYSTLPWPPGTDMLLVDFSQAMIEHFWSRPKETVLCTDWLSMDLPQGSRDIVLGDGALPLLDYPREQRDLVRILYRALSEKGLCILRTFVLPPEPETPESVIGDLLDGKVGDLSALVLRMNMAMQDDPEKGIAFGRVYEAIGAIPDLAEVLATLGWSEELLTLIEHCKSIERRTHLLTFDQTVDLFCRDPGGFRVHTVCTPPGGLEERCPTIAFERM